MLSLMINGDIQLTWMRTQSIFTVSKLLPYAITFISHVAIFSPSSRSIFDAISYRIITFHCIKMCDQIVHHVIIDPILPLADSKKNVLYHVLNLSTSALTFATLQLISWSLLFSHRSVHSLLCFPIL